MTYYSAHFKIQISNKKWLLTVDLKKKNRRYIFQFFPDKGGLNTVKWHLGTYIVINEKIEWIRQFLTIPDIDLIRHSGKTEPEQKKLKPKQILVSVVFENFILVQ